jgi:CheY-like chemotaxis protein
MAIRRALVVDDSKSARIALKKQLEAYDLAVELADSGEEALDFLKHEHVDVIFMDHVMPGMDGLSAVKALKSNPETATIPVMMYTSKEGELYVSQARALGAVDVLPKQTQPGVLFGMLLKLGLVRDRRAAGAGQGAPAETGDRRGGADSEPPPGMAIPSLVSRILEDQRSAMRSDLVNTQMSFARQVANEIYERQRADEPPEERATNPFVDVGLPIATVVFAMAAVLFAILFFDARSEREAARMALADVASTVRSQVAQAMLDAAPARGAGTGNTAESADKASLVGALTWALNQTGTVPFGETPFDRVRAAQISELLGRLTNEGFQGTVIVESHLGEYCLTVGANGLYEPAQADTPISACALTGHPLDDSSMLDDRTTPEFEVAIAKTLERTGSMIDLRLIGNDRMNSIPLVAYPFDAATAGEWNRIAAANNRVEYSLLVE